MHVRIDFRLLIIINESLCMEEFAGRGGGETFACEASGNEGGERDLKHIFISIFQFGFNLELDESIQKENIMASSADS